MSYDNGPAYKKPKDFKPEPRFADGHKKAGLLRCHAWARRRNRQCDNSPIEGRVHCRMHKKAIGAANGQFKTGEYSQCLPERMAANYERARDNPELVSLKEEIALVEMHQKDLALQFKEGGDSLETWKLLRETLIRFNQTKKEAAKAEYLGAMLDLIEKGSGQAAVWSDLYNAFSMKRRLVDTEFRKNVQYGHMLNIEQLMAIIGRLLSIIKGYVDTDQFARLAGELRGLVHQGDNGRVDGGHAETLPRPRTDRVRADAVVVQSTAGAAD